ncbi:hypothetical protein ACF1BU_06050 [Streptomyces sp. NPDC014724]|uniref:hypothetical protein n=1 Tax=unclassified Streptomyces TaxID=2593676 RepID=UPI0036FE924B
MVVPLWVLAVVIPEFVLTSMVLRWLPAKQERWMAALPFPAMLVMAPTLRFVAQVQWPGVLATCAGLLWGVAIALLPFRGWVSSWTLPARGQGHLGWREVALVALGVLTPLTTKASDAAMEKAFAVRQVVRARGEFPWPMGVALLAIPVGCAVGAGWAVDTLGWG